MSEFEKGPQPERKNDFESRLEKAENIVEVLELVDEIIVTRDYIDHHIGWEKIALANRTGIQKFTRKKYFEAFDDKYGMAIQYMDPPGDNE